MGYHLTGAISTFFFLLSIAGYITQIRLIWSRKLTCPDEAPTAVLSLNQFSVSYLAFFSFFVYGYCLERFNHYLVWPRLVACCLALTVVFEIARDRRNAAAVCTFVALCASLIGGLSLLALGSGVTIQGRGLSQGLIVLVAVLLAQGYGHQIARIRRAGQTGAVSWWMHFLTLVKDLSTLAFAIAMGFSAGWPLMLMCTVSISTKIVILWHFAWAKRSPLALSRRQAQN